MNFLQFVHQYSLSNFKLTNKMIEKNNYENCNVYVESDYDGLTGLCIYHNNVECQSIIIDVLEVRSDCRKQGIGTKLINKIKKLNKPIGLHSLESAMGFYEKRGFYQSDPDVLEFEYTPE